jgi:predicted nucleotidyltransferase
MRGDGAAPPDIAGASALLLFGSAVLCGGSTGKEKRHKASDKDILVHGNFFAQ